jgi:hypothetical protein
MASEYISAIIAADGNIDLAAERLGIKKQELVVDLLQDEELQTAIPSMKLLLSISMFDVIKSAHLALIESMSSLEPYELSKTYSSFVDSFVRLTGADADGSSGRVDPSTIKDNIMGKLLELDTKRRERSIPEQPTGEGTSAS